MSMPLTESAKTTAIDELKTFLRTERDGRQVKKAVAVKLISRLRLRGDYQHFGCLDGGLSKWNQAYEREDLPGFRPQHKGRQSYLTPKAKESVLKWLQTKKM